MVCKLFKQETDGLRRWSPLLLIFLKLRQIPVPYRSRDYEQQGTANAIYVHVAHFVKDMGPVNAQECHCELLKALDGKNLLTPLINRVSDEGLPSRKLTTALTNTSA